MRALVLAVALHASSVAAAPLPFVDDWPRALAEARSRGIPVFVEAWAPW